MRKSLLAMASLGIASLHPKTQQSLWRWWYNQLAKRDQDELLLMNYGYCDGEGIALTEAQELYRYPLQLYRYVATAEKLAGKVLLEAGCGRGGGLQYLHEKLGPECSIGVDLSHTATSRAQKELARQNLYYLCGDVQKLPIRSKSVHRVINVESSHCYPYREQFLAEVARVLCQEGKFYICDFVSKKDVPNLERQLENHMKLVHRETINDNVLSALDKVYSARLEKINRRVPVLFKLMFKHFIAAPGSILYDKMQTGEVLYRLYRLEK